MLLDQKRFDFRNDKLLNERVTMSILLGLNELSQSSRTSAWQVVLGIDPDSSETLNYRELYYDFLIQKIEPNTPMNEIDNMIVKDVYRTFSTMQKFNQKPSTGQNRLYNILKSYALYDPDVGYTQGMNFIAALILL